VPKPVGRSQRYMPGLDGLRALAVVAVIGYHLGVPWLPGGLLGVGVFFTLSGYLITDLLLSSWEATGSLCLRQFWARRARRLLPALFVMLAVVSTWAALAQPSQLGELRGQVLAATFYVSNWWAVFHHVPYFARFGLPSPLGHLWSLAIEEQFYLVWPWLLWLGLIWAMARRRRGRAKASSGVPVPPPIGQEHAGASSAGSDGAHPGAGQLAGGAGRQPLGAPALDRWGPERELALAGYGLGEVPGRGYDSGAGLRLLGPPPALRWAPSGGEQRPEDDRGRSEADEPHWQGPDLLALGYLLSGRSATLTGRPPAPYRAEWAARPVPRGWQAGLVPRSSPGARVPWAEASPEREPLAERAARYFGVPGTRRALWPLAVAATVLAGASAVEMALVYHPSFDPSRAYDGTDTRAFALLLGGALAMVLPSKGLRHQLSRGAKRALKTLGAVSLGVAIALMCSVGEYSSWLYHGGMVLLSLATLGVVAAAAHPASSFGRVLGVRPLRWLGERSYAAYLWHYPVIVLTAPSPSTGFDLPRAVLQVVGTLVLAELSWRFVESPVRRGALGRAWRELGWHPSRWLSWARGCPYRRVALGGVPAFALLAVVALAGGLSGPAGELGTRGLQAGGLGQAAAPPTTAPPTTAPPTTVSTTSRPATSGPSEQPTKSPGAPAPGPIVGKQRSLRPEDTASAVASAVPSAARHHLGSGASRPKPASARPGPVQLRTSCKQVVHMGDSTSESLVSPNYLPDPAQRLGAQYERVGVKQSVMEVEGGTSIVETLPGEPNMYQVAQSLVHQGYHGCWVFALGTNDAADVYVGSNVGMAERVREMMSLVGNDPVLWVNVKTLVATGPYAEANMEKWDQVLLRACPLYPNMAVFNWAGAVQRSWFIRDGIHYSSEGSAKRAAAIADALATAFPAGGPLNRRARRCLVNASPKWDLPNFQY
jgi:peptidoglycan/LPS O-acetylase OafA/YrhL